MERLELKIIRAQRGLTAKEAAQGIGIARESLLNLENGKYRGHPSTWIKIARFYGIPESEIAKLRGSKNKKKGKH